jgi:hypothetical protein
MKRRAFRFFDGAAGAYAETLPVLLELAKREGLAIIAPLSLRTTWDILSRVLRRRRAFHRVFD